MKTPLRVNTKSLDFMYSGYVTLHMYDFVAF